jgi:hypothetical protein
MIYSAPRRLNHNGHHHGHRHSRAARRIDSPEARGAALMADQTKPVSKPKPYQA